MQGIHEAQEPLQTFGQAPRMPGEPDNAADTVSLFGPRGAWVSARQWTWIADTGQHRVLGFAPGEREPRVCLGQPDLSGDAPNAGAEPDPGSLYMPVGLCGFGAEGLVVADSWNHRVLIWHSAPQTAGQRPDLVLGQADMIQGQANRGKAAPAADTLFWPSGVFCDDEILAVADAGNRRVLLWLSPPDRDGQAADRVLGQTSMHRRDQNAGRPLDAQGMVWPHAITRWQGRLMVTDAGCSRVMGWEHVPDNDGAPAGLVLGQKDMSARLHNRGQARPSEASLAMPYGIASWRDWLLVADTANSRLLGWNACQSQASWLHGQMHFELGGDNRWSEPQSDSLCWPYGLSVSGDQLSVADTGNNRVQCWNLRECLPGEN